MKPTKPGDLWWTVGWLALVAFGPLVLRLLRKG